MKSTMESNSNKGTMRPLGLQNSAGSFGLKKHMNIPPALKEELEAEEIAEEMEGEMAPEIKEAQTVPTVEEEVEEEVVKEVVEEKVEPTTDVPEEEEDTTEDIKETFECPVCHREFKAKIGLIGHLRGPCGKKK